MIELGSTSSETRTVTAFFDTNDHASTARADLIAAGVPDSDITLLGNEADLSATHESHHRGFWESLADFFMPDDDRRAYAEGLRRGGFAISVKAGGTLYDRAIDILDRDGAVDLDERELSWASEGWSRSSGGVDDVVGTTAYRPADDSTAGFGGSHAGEDGIGRIDETAVSDLRDRIAAGTASPVAPAPTGGPQTHASPASPAADAKADIVEGRAGDGDNLFGRRDLTHGRSRVRSYLVENDRE